MPTFTPEILERLALRARNPMTAAVIRSGELDSVRDTDGTVYTRPGLVTRDEPAVVTRAPDPVRPQAKIARPHSGRPTPEEIERAKNDPKVSAAAFREMLGLPPHSTVAHAEPPSPAKEDVQARMIAAWHDETPPGPPAPLPPATTPIEEACRAWDAGGASPAECARLADDRAKRSSALAAKIPTARSMREREQGRTEERAEDPQQLAVDAWNKL